MIRVVVTGSECTGKTTLAEDLARHYRTIFVPEYVRRFVEKKGSAPALADVAAIALMLIELEDRLAAQVRRLLVLDTDLLSTIVYSHHYFGNCPAWVEKALTDRAADLYLLAGIDVPWVPDDVQRDRGDRREEMHGLFRAGLTERGLQYQEIHGSRRQRLRDASAVIDRLIS